MVRDVFARLERFYDAVPRDRARAEDFGTLVLFVPDRSRHGFYARPKLGVATPSAADLDAVRARQRELRLPEAVEWVHETTPGLLPIVEAAGLPVLHAPLLVLDPAALPVPAPPAGVTLRTLDPSTPRFAADLSIADAVAAIGFGAPGTAPGTAGAAARDGAVAPWPAEAVTQAAERRGDGRFCEVLAEPASGGAVAAGGYQRVGPVAEIVGVATLPAARRQGLGGAVTAALARHALDAGCELVFLSAGSEQIARVYERIGFRRTGTACIAEPNGT